MKNTRSISIADLISGELSPIFVSGDRKASQQAGRMSSRERRRLEERQARRQAKKKVGAK